MYKRIAAAVAVIILASVIVVSTAKALPRIVKNENSEVNLILQSGE